MTLMALGLITVGCGKKGPPLAPLHLVPAAVSEVSARRIADTVRLRFVLPSRNENGPGRLELDRIEIYAMTLAAGSADPGNRELLSKSNLAGTIEVRPVLDEGEPGVPNDPRPEPGSAVTFDEELTSAKLVPVPVKEPAAKPAAAVVPPATVPTPPAAGPAPPNPAAKRTDPAVVPPSTTPAGAVQAPAAAAEAVAPPPAFPQRIYMILGVTRTGRTGTASPRTAVPLVQPPAPPPNGRTRFTEKGVVVIEWDAPAETVTGYNVYGSGDVMRPLNPAPLAALTFEQATPASGEEHCYRIRSLTSAGGVTIEGDASEPSCITPQDKFPPAAPVGLAAVPTAGQISLIWDPNTDRDLAGYVVLRGEAPGGPLQAITPAPIRETSYRDSTVKPGVRYIYAVVAVDTAKPPNMSAQSARVEETAR